MIIRKILHSWDTSFTKDMDIYIKVICIKIIKYSFCIKI
jgi:hypothetical protein